MTIDTQAYLIKIGSGLLVLTFALARPALPQTPPSVSGIVTDDTKAPLAGVTIVLAPADGGKSRESVTDSEGRFAVAGIAPGHYAVKASLDGFQTATVPLDVGAEPPDRLHIKMRVSAIEEEVTVIGKKTGDPLSPAGNADAVALNYDVLRSLPTDGQNVLSLVTNFLAPEGVAQGVSIVIDGMEGADLNVPTSSIHRLSFNRNPYSAEFRSAGKSRVEVQTERGSRRVYHGSAALFERDSVLMARNAFAATKPDLTRRLAEAAVGGPLPGKGYSFFFSGDHLINDDSVVVNALSPTGPVIQNVPAPQRRSNVMAGLDWRRRSELSVRYNPTDLTERNRGVGGFRLPNQRFDSSARGQQVIVGHHIVVSSTFVNDARLTVSHDRGVEGVLPSAPQVVVVGAFSSGPSPRFGETVDTSITVQEKAVLIRGAHTIQFGATARPKSITVTDASNFGGTFEFGDLAHYIRGEPSLYRLNRGQPTVSFTNNTASAFVEDAILLRPDVSLTAGLRDDVLSHVARAHNLAPRLALAFAPGAQKTVLRVGVGRFLDHLPQSAISRSELLDGVRTREIVIAHPTYPDPFNGRAGNLVPSGVTRLAADLLAPDTTQAGVSLERRLWGRSVLTVEYQWLRTADLLRTRDVNAPLPLVQTRPDPAFLNINQIESSAVRRGQSLGFTFNGHLVHFKTIAKYTLSRTTDDASSAFSLPANNYDLSGELGRADFDRRHRFSLMSVREWHDGAWRVAPVLVVTSGAPFNITTGFDDNGDTVANDRPLGVGRNTGRGPGFVQLDVRVARVLRIGSAVNSREPQPQTLELSLDVFNVTDHSNYESFVGISSSPLFGRPNTAKQARTVQLSAKYRF